MKYEKREIEPIAYIKSDYKEKFGIPRQSGRASSIAEIVFLPKYRNPDALRRIEEFTYLWLIFDFSEAHISEFKPTVRPPKLGGNTKVGVFASRSPFRPNSLGLSSVSLIDIKRTDKDGIVLVVGGADLLDGTPIFDIKPYLPRADSHPDAKGGYSESFWNSSLSVVFDDENEKNKIKPEIINQLMNILSDDPRPSYKNDSEYEYGMRFAEYDIHFKVNDNILHVTRVDLMNC